MDATALGYAGFTQDDGLKQQLQDAADAQMHESGPYKVLEAWRQGVIQIVVEQNTAAEDLGGGTTAVVTYPPVAVIEGPGGRVCCNPNDTDLVVSVASGMVEAATGVRLSPRPR